MALSCLVARLRVGGLAAVLASGALLLAQAAPAAAAPAPSSSSAPTGAAAPSSATSSTTASNPAPQVTAPPSPADHGPQCPTDATALYPVVCLPDGSGEDQTASLSAGDETEFDAQVVNNGPAVTDATVVITLPKGLDLESDEDDPVYRIDDWYGDNKGDFTDLTCTGDASTISCDVGPLAQYANILIGIDLEVADDATPGSSLPFQVALRPAGGDTYPSTSVTATIAVLTPSHLVVSLTPATLRTVVGRSATVTGTVRNAGTQPAPDTVAAAISLDEKHPTQTHFVITNGRHVPIDGDPSDEPTDDSGEISVSAGPIAGQRPLGSTVAVLGTRHSSTVRTLLQRRALDRVGSSVERHALPSLAFWPLGTLAPGAVAHVAIELKAVTVGTDTLAFEAISGEPDCDGLDDGSSGGGSASSGPSDPDSSAPAAPSGSASSTAQQSIVPLARVAASGTTAPADCSFLVTTHITAIPQAAATTAPLADTGTRALDTELGIAVWAIVLGGLLTWVGRRRLAVARHRG